MQQLQLAHCSSEGGFISVNARLRQDDVIETKRAEANKAKEIRIGVSLQCPQGAQKRSKVNRSVQQAIYFIEEENYVFLLRFLWIRFLLQQEAKINHFLLYLSRLGKLSK